MSDGSQKVAGPTLKNNRGKLLFSLLGEGGSPRDGLMRGPGQTESDQTRLCWTSRGARDLMFRLKLRKADWFSHGRFLDLGLF